MYDNTTAPKHMNTITFSRVSSMMGGTPLAFSLPLVTATCLRNSTFFLLARKRILVSQKTMMVSVSSQPKSHVCSDRKPPIMHVQPSLLCFNKCLTRVTRYATYFCMYIQRLIKVFYSFCAKLQCKLTWETCSNTNKQVKNDYMVKLIYAKLTDTGI